MGTVSFNTSVQRLGRTIAQDDDQVWRLLTRSDKEFPTYIIDKNGNLDSTFKEWKFDIPENVTGEINLGAFGKLFDVQGQHQEVKLKTLKVLFSASGKGDRFIISGLYTPLLLDIYNEGVGTGVVCEFNNPQTWAGHVDVMHAKYYKVDMALAFNVYVTVEYLIDRTVYPIP